MLHLAECALQLILHPFGMTESFRRRPPVKESAALFALVLLCVFGYLTGLLGAELRHAFLGSFVTVTGAMVATAGVIVFSFLLHMNALILGGNGRFVTLFSVQVILLCALLVFFRLPLHLLVSLTPLTASVVSFNAVLNLILLTSFFAYLTIAVRSLYQLPFGQAAVAFALLPLYGATVAASFRFGLRWFA